MIRLVAGFLVLLGAVLLVATAFDDPQPGSGSLVFGVAALVVGLALGVVTAWRGRRGPDVPGSGPP